MKMTTVVARAIRRKLTRGGFSVGYIRNRPLPDSAEGIQAGMIVSSRNGTQFHVSVYQIKEGSK